MFSKKNLSEVKFERALHRDGTAAPDLIDVILQNYSTCEVLFGASMSRETLEETIQTGFAVLYSKSRKSRWKKGEGSGDLLQVMEVFLNCDKNQLLVRVIPLGAGICHEKDERGIAKATCFSRLVVKQKIRGR